MDDDFQITIEVESLLKLKSSDEVDFFDTVKFQEGVGKLPAWCVSGIDPSEVVETEKNVFEVQKKMEKFKKKPSSFDEFLFFEPKPHKTSQIGGGIRLIISLLVINSPPDYEKICKFEKSAIFSV